MRRRRRIESGFTLVELVIVIVILGILASIAVPQIMGSQMEAQDTALKSTVTTLRNAIEYYASQHGGKFPGAKADGLGNNAGTEAAVKSQLIYYSKADGTCSVSKAAGYQYGPYLRKEFPNVPCGNGIGKNTIKVTADKSALVATDKDGVWMMSYETGEIICNDTSTDSGGTKKYSEY